MVQATGKRAAVMQKRPNSPQVYIVCWPEMSVIKVGMTAYRRWSGFVLRGATAVALYRLPTWREQAQLEVDLDRELRKYGSYAFDTKEGAVPYLGDRGAGYLECIRVEPSQFEHVLEVLREHVPESAVEHMPGCRCWHYSDSRSSMAKDSCPSMATYVRTQLTHRLVTFERESFVSNAREIRGDSAHVRELSTIARCAAIQCP